MSAVGDAASYGAARGLPAIALEATHEPSELTVRVVTKEDQFDALQAMWQQLFAASDNHTPFQTWEWIRTWWQHFGRPGDLRLYVIEQAGETIGIAPLYLRRRLRGWPLPHLAFIAQGRADYLDFLVRPGREKAFFTALFTHLRHDRRPDWRLLELRDIPEGSANLQPLMHCALHASFQLNQQPAEACVTVPLLPTWDGYLASLGKKARSNLRRHRRQLADEFQIEWFIPRTEQEFRRAFDDFVALYRARWRSTDGTTLFDSTASLAFERDICRLGASAGWYRSYMLYADSAPVAGYLGYVCNRKYYAGLLTYAPAYNRYGVGSTLIGMAIEDCIGNHWAEIDMMRGDEEFKYQWNGRRKLNYTMRLSTRRSALCAANSLDWAFSTLVRSKSLHRLRALWRRWRATGRAAPGAGEASASA
jgi:CelD/BcsL family acetyltransferase involved in cellulose biosynthesis